MRRTIIKTFLAWNFDKEEQWINEMSSKGLQLVNVGFCTYTFKESVPNEYNYRIELLNDWPSSSASSEYIRFVEDTGAEHIDSFMRWVYFRRGSDKGTFDLFSDIDSRIKHLDRVLHLLICILPLLIFNVWNAFRMFSEMGLGFSLFLSLTLVMLLLTISGLFKTRRKIDWLKNERNIRE